jgi:hypothetical protein
MIRSILLDRYALKDSLEIYSIFFQSLLYFLHILEVYMNFWNYKRKWYFKILGAQCWAALWPGFRPSSWPSSPVAQLAWPCGHLAWRGHGGAVGPGSPADKLRWGRWHELIESECPIFRWVGIISTWWKMTLTIWLRRASPKRQCYRWTNSLWLPTLLMQDQPDHEDHFLSAIEERTRKRCEQSNNHSKVEFWNTRGQRRFARVQE